MPAFHTMTPEQIHQAAENMSRDQNPALWEKIDALRAQLTESQAREETLSDALQALLRRDERNTCQHDTTHRGGAQWEICDLCGAQWADDEGGRPKWEDPQEWVDARAALTKLQEVKS